MKDLSRYINKVPVKVELDTSMEKILAIQLLYKQVIDIMDTIEGGSVINVQSDWNAEAGSEAEILNKPTLATVATSGNYTDLLNKPEVPVKIETEDITALTSEQLESLKSGDVVVKITGTQKHSYRVSFKGATGLCLTYTDCENLETIAYEKTGDTWSYDSTDITSLAQKASVAMVNEESAFQKNLAAITGLAADPNAGTTTVTTNPEWKLVYTDADDRILLGKRQDDTWYFAADLDDILDAIIDGYGT